MDIRIAVVADIHGNLPAIEAVVKNLTHQSVDAVVNLGDNLSGPLLPKETAQFLMTQEWTHIAGNHERQLLTIPPEELALSDAHAYNQLTQKEMSWMRSLPPFLVFNAEVDLFHGSPRSDKEYFLETVEPGRIRPATPEEVEQRLGDRKTQVILCGHTHIPRSVRTRAGQLIVNPGSVGLQAYDDDLPDYHIIQNGSPDARYAIVEKRGKEWSAQLIAVPYDHRPMADLARKSGRTDWETALKTGYLG